MVYVDDAAMPYRGMLMCHMVADTHRELMAMADTVGVHRKWIQKLGEPFEHFDIAMGKRQTAVEAGAIEITSREVVRMLRTRQAQGRGGLDEYYERRTSEL
jgi:hypothetical protein